MPLIAAALFTFANFAIPKLNKTMKFISTITFLVFANHLGFSQIQADFKKENRKGNLYFYWGWNHSGYSKSDISFAGNDYNFKLKNVAAGDRQTKFTVDSYFHILKFSTPQYNFRVGYFLNDHYDISFGIDHMKYVVELNQKVGISGNISNTETSYDGIYENDEITIEKGFLEFEHTDGLNYPNIELRRFDEILDFNKIKINLTEGLGAGILLPRTNATLLGNERYDEFNLAGYGVSAVVGLNITFFDCFFIQSEFKGGFINMPNVRTTKSEADRASQHFFFAQQNIVFGGIVKLGKKNRSR